MRAQLGVFFLVFRLLQTGKCISLQPGTYRIIGAEGDASLTTGPPQFDQLTKVSMKFWNGTTTIAQQWRVIAKDEGQQPTFSLVNSAVEDNVLSLHELHGNFRVWKMVELGNGVTQIKDGATGRCLKRLGVTVYDEGTLCDMQAQSQQWKFLLT